MRLLVDECLARRVADLLAEHDHDVVHVGDLNLLGQPDEVIMAAARSAGRVLVSADTDFGELLQFSGADAPSVVLLRRRTHDPRDQAAAIAAALVDVATDLVAGAIVVVTESRIRVRSLPIEKTNRRR